MSCSRFYAQILYRDHFLVFTCVFHFLHFDHSHAVGLLLETIIPAVVVTITAGLIVTTILAYAKRCIMLLILCIATVQRSTSFV